jgi:diguanylate cyclase (GGDEF)-like protein
LFTRLFKMGIAGTGLLLVAGSYIAVRHLPGSYYQVSWFAGVAGAAILAAWVSRSTDGRRRQLERDNAEAGAVLEIAQMANAAVNLEATLDLVVLTLQRLLGGPACAVFLVNREGSQLEMLAGAGVAAVGPLDLHLDDQGWSPSSGIPLLIDDVQRGGPSPITQIQPECRSVLCVPLRTVERVLGMLYIGQRGADRITEWQVRLLETIAGRIVFPIERLLVQEKLEREASLDPLTGLLNCRRLEQALAAEVKRSERYRHPLSIIMLDLDQLARYNDRYGHTRGNSLLVAAAQFVKANVREVDRVARYGGDEFCVICPETSREDAFVLAERLCRQIMAAPFLDLGNGPEVTVSGGVATYPEDGRSAADLLAGADAAVDAVKRLGGSAVGAGGEQRATEVTAAETPSRPAPTPDPQSAQADLGAPRSAHR